MGERSHEVECETFAAVGAWIRPANLSVPVVQTRRPSKAFEMLNRHVLSTSNIQRTQRASNNMMPQDVCGFFVA